MNLQEIFCPNITCPARGQVNADNISVHSQAEQRCHCDVCNTTFSVKKGTIFYRLKTDPGQVMLVLTLLAYGCPVKAIVAAFGFDERTVKKWWKRAGEHCQQVHQQVVEQSQFDLQQVQADEIKAKLQGSIVWIAYVKAFQRAFRSKLPRCEQVGRAKWRAWSELSFWPRANSVN